MAFQFSLAAVLRVRGILEEREERMLQKILFEISQSFEALAQIDAEISGTNASRRAEILRPVVGRQIHVSYGEVKELKQKRIDVLDRIEKLEQLRDKQLILYEKARRNREMLTDMRDEKRSAYDSDLARSEQKTLDDNYIARRGLS
jgi:flagellar export protein FliJ